MGRISDDLPQCGIWFYFSGETPQLRCLITTLTLINTLLLLLKKSHIPPNNLLSSMGEKRDVSSYGTVCCLLFSNNETHLCKVHIDIGSFPSYLRCFFKKNETSQSCFKLLPDMFCSILSVSSGKKFRTVLYFTLNVVCRLRKLPPASELPRCYP